MAENVAFKTNVEKGAAQIKETSEQFSAATEQMTKMVENSFAPTVKGIKDYNFKAIEFAQLNSDVAFDCAKRLMSAKSPSEMVEFWTAYARKQFEVLTEQIKELAMLCQTVASETAEPFAKRRESFRDN